MRKVNFAGLLVLGAVASGSVDAAVVDATPQQVAHCTFIRDVEHSTAGEGKYTTAAIGAAMTAARLEAEHAGATHVVWDKVDPDTVQKVTGKAYQCAK